MAAALIVGACTVDRGYTAWVLNDSSASVVVDTRTQLHATVVVPPHTYGPLFEVRGPSSADWTVRVVNVQCSPLQSWPADANHDLVYISPAGERTFVSALAWDYGLKTATQSTLARRDPPCP
jgi:hypothetical protein